MMHDKLMLRIDKCIAEAYTYRSTTYLPMVLNALRAVADLHNSWEGARMNGGGHNGPWCTHCEEVFDGSIRYPCPTIQAIEKEIGSWGE